MEKKHSFRIKSNYPDIVSSKVIYCLHITDDYFFMDNYLIEILENSFDEMLLKIKDT